MSVQVAVGRVRRTQAAWVGTISAVLGHHCRRAVEHSALHRIVEAERVKTPRRSEPLDYGA